MKRSFAILSFLSLVLSPVLAATTPAAPEFNEVLATSSNLKELRAGGLVLYMRHGNTDNSRADRVPTVDLHDCSTQRMLNDGGRKTAALVGKSMRKAGIPIGEIRVSPLCRAKDTTEIAYGKNYTIDLNLMYTANLTDEQKKLIIANTRSLLSRPVSDGKNRLLVAHAPNLMDLIDYFPKEGTIVIFRPKGPAGFEYIASIPPEFWGELLNQANK